MSALYPEEINHIYKNINVDGTDVILQLKKNRKNNSVIVNTLSKTELTEYPLSKAMADGSLTYAVSVISALALFDNSLLISAVITLGYPISILFGVGLNKFLWKKKDFTEGGEKVNKEIFNSIDNFPNREFDINIFNKSDREIIKIYRESLLTNDSKTEFDKNSQMVMDKTFTEIFDKTKSIEDDESEIVESSESSKSSQMIR